MKLSLFSIGLYSTASLIGILSSVQTIASAQCVVTDVSVQAAIHGSRTPADQENDVNIDHDGRCTGNRSTHTSTQVHVGGNKPVKQTRTSNHRISGGRRNNRNGRGGPMVEVQVDVPVDVHNSGERYRR